MASVGYSYAVLKGRVTGDKDRARKFLLGLSPAQRTMRNRSESRLQSRAGKRYKMGRRTKRSRRWQ